MPSVRSQLKRLYRHIHRYAPYPPRALVSSLRRELEKYDQLCDAMQSHIVRVSIVSSAFSNSNGHQSRAINVLKRDLEKEQNRIKVEEEAAAAAAALATTRVPPNSPTVSPTVSGTPEPGPKGPSMTARRQSTISLSSLHRPAFPHKLDLSAATLRLNPEDLGLQSGLASPVMLAPKSSISRVPPDFPFGSSGEVDIGLTLDYGVSAELSAPGSSGSMVGIDPTLGSSADKPIELLGLDIELFSENTTVSNTTGSTSGHDAGPVQPAPPIKQETIEFGLFNFPAAGAPGEEDTKADASLLASLSTDPLQSGPSIIGATDQQQQSLGLLDSGSSPSSLLAGFQAASSSGSTGQGDANSASFGSLSLDFLKEEGMMDVQALFDINGSVLGQNTTNTT